MRRSNALVSGINGLGVEIAKNLALAGVKSVTLHDEETVGCRNLSSNFFISEDGSRKNCIEACVQKLQELNSAVLIKALTEKLSKEQLSDFQVVVFTDLSLEKAIEYDDYCHNHKPPIPFIKSEVQGLFGNVFFYFGPGFTVFDVDDEEPRTGIIVSISNDNPALVSCVDDERLEFQDGDLVVFSEVKGMTELNDGKPRKVINAGPYSFFLEEDSTHFCAYDRGGIVMQVKQPKILHFKTLRDSLKDPGDFYLTDFSKYDRPPLLHLAFQALDKFRHDFGRFPVTESEEDVQRLIGLAVSINETSGDCKVKEVDEKLLRYFKTGSREVLSPMAAMFGVIVGQEVVKACLGKSHPIVQFFYFDSIESLPVELQKPEDLKPLNSCHDAQIISVLGLNLQKKLEQVIGFMAGAGALGCEFLKFFAIIGVCCSRIGKLTTTDDDVFEKSKLSRQFMFRDWNIGQSNSTVAATAASTINPALPVEALQNRVCPVPEDVYNDAFYERRDSTVVNTLDSVNAKLYVECTFRSCSWNLEPWVPSVTPRWLYLT